MKNKIIFIFLTFFTAVWTTNVQASSGEKSQLNSSSESTQSESPPTTFKKSSNIKNAANLFKPPKQSQPKYTIGGATRGDLCVVDQENNRMITALVPALEQSLTIKEYPALFAYVSPLTEAKSAVLIVKDEAEDYYHTQRLTIPASGGVIKMTLAENAPPLEIDHQYTWFLRIQCNNDYLEPEDPQISYSITRIQGDLISLTQEELVSFYANDSIWYDSLNNAFELAKFGENTYWQQLLNSIGMEKLATKPIIGNLSN